MLIKLEQPFMQGLFTPTFMPEHDFAMPLSKAHLPQVNHMVKTMPAAVKNLVLLNR